MREGGENGIGQTTFGVNKPCRGVLVTAAALDPIHPTREIIDQVRARVLSDMDSPQRNRQRGLSIPFHVPISHERFDSACHAESADRPSHLHGAIGCLSGELNPRFPVHRYDILECCRLLPKRHPLLTALGFLRTWRREPGGVRPNGEGGAGPARARSDQAVASPET